MDSKKINLIWAISLCTIGTATIILAMGNLTGIEQADHMVRICGTVDLVSLPVFAFLTVKKAKNRK